MISTKVLTILCTTVIATVLFTARGRAAAPGVANKGMEGLAITPDGRLLIGAMQSPLIQDGGDVKGGITRLVAIDTRSGATREYAYQLDTGVKTTVSEILAINDHELLVDERDSKVRHTLYVANDNDYSPVVTNTNGTTTSNPNRFFVFAFSDADLPRFVPQGFVQNH